MASAGKLRLARRRGGGQASPRLATTASMGEHRLSRRCLHVGGRDPPRPSIMAGVRELRSIVSARAGVVELRLGPLPWLA